MQCEGHECAGLLFGLASFEGGQRHEVVDLLPKKPSTFMNIYWSKVS